MSLLLQAKDIVATVPLNRQQRLTTVDHFSFDFEEATSYAITGKSGSGKTSLLSILGLLNNAYTGELIWRGHDVSRLNDTKKSAIRAKEMGFMFQNYSLIPHLRIWENLELVLRYGGDRRSLREKQKSIESVLEQVGLKDKGAQYPSHLSGGEQQRIALARALVAEPSVLMCDEPTGALDTKTGTKVMDYLLDQVNRQGLSLILVTHDIDLANRCDIQLEIQEGRLTHVARTP